MVRRVSQSLSLLLATLTLCAGGAALAERPDVPHVAEVPGVPHIAEVPGDPAIASVTAPGGVPQIAEVPQAAPPVPLLWKVAGEHGDLYLLGSFHFLKPEDYPLDPDVEQALALAGEIVFELSPEELGSPTLAMQMMQAGLRTDGSRLDDDLDAEATARLDAWARENQATLQTTGVGAQAFQLFEPWFASLLVTTTELGRYGLQAQLGLDVHLARRAGEVGTPTAGLETAAQQIEFLDGMETAAQVQMLVDALDQADAGPVAIEALHATWRAGDADRLWTEMAGDMRHKAPELYARINTMRNDAWLPKLEQMLQQDGDILVVVGALHLLGEDGVVEKLAAKGYAVERVCTACAGASPAGSAASAR